MNRKHYILVSITIPETKEPDLYKVWQNFWQNYKKQCELPPGVERLGSNVWLLQRDTGMSYLARLICDAEPVGLQCKVRFLTEDDF